MLDNLINAKGGLHNRLTGIIHLHPFSLFEAKNFLLKKGFRWDESQILEAYMAIGGVPHYLNHLENTLSANQNINRLCFHPDGLLFDEYKRLLKSLFDKSGIHQQILKEISLKRYGVSRNELLKKLNLKSGGTFNERLDELEASHFIESFVPFGNKRKEFFVKVIDEYVLFYNHWIQNTVQKKGFRYYENYWINISKEPSWKSWAGYAFEAICYKHINQVLKSLNLENATREIGTWKKTCKSKLKNTGEKGAQIDLLVDRTDNAISICEMKYAKQPFIIDSKCAQNLLHKADVFKASLKQDKTIFYSLISPYGIKNNAWSDELNVSAVTLKDLFGS